MNASDERGINTVRNEVLNFASSGALFSTKHKLIILDEADSMTNEAQSALRRVIEKYTRNVRFCLVCNYLTGIIPAIQSRCMRFRFFPLPQRSVIRRLNYILRQENVVYDQNGVNALVRASGGDMRKVLNTLQTTFMSYGEINEDTIKRTTGYPSSSDISKMLDMLFNCDIKTCYKHLLKCSMIQGVALTNIIKELLLELKTLSLPPEILSYLIENMANIEYNASTGPNIKIHISALVSGFYNARVELEKANS